MAYNNQKGKCVCNLLFPSQNNNELLSFLSNFEQLLNDINKRKPSSSVITRDFNAISSSRSANDINTTEGSKLHSFTSSNGFSQLINEPTFIEINSSLCIDLIFVDQPSLSVNTGVHTTFDPNCHHQIVHSSSNLNICYPPPY